MCFRKNKRSKEVIEFDGNNNDLLQIKDVAKSYHEDAVVVAPMTHTALIIENGALREQISGGSVPLYAKAEPRGCLFGGLLGLLFGKKRHTAIYSLKIIYISKTARLTINWGTNINQRITYVEPSSGRNVSVGAFGAMDIRVRDPQKFYLELVAAHGDYSLKELQTRVRDMTVNETFRVIKQALVLRNPAYTEFDYAKDDIQDRASEMLSAKYVDEFGFDVTNFRIENLNIDPESLQELQSRNIEDSTFTREEFLYDRDRDAARKRKRDDMADEDLDFARGEVVYDREKEAERKRKQDRIADLGMDDTIYDHDLKHEREQQDYDRARRYEEEDREAARQERNWAHEDKKMESEERKSGMYYDAVKTVGWEDKNDGSSDDKKQKSLGHHCTVCGAAYTPGAKYCPVCGATLPVKDATIICPKCLASVPWGTQHCPNCGEKLYK